MRGFGTPGLWLWTLLAACPAAGLRINPGGLPRPDEYSSPSAQCTGKSHEAVLTEDETDGPLEVDHTRLFPNKRSLLNGTQWCLGKRPPTFRFANPLANRVAVIMIGQPFRSKNYYSGMRSACTDGTVDAQRILARNHLEQLVLPVETHFRMSVDIFLSDSSCAEEDVGVLGSAGRSNGLGSSANLDLLKDWYTRERVKGVVTTPVAMHMNSRVAEAFRHVDDYMMHSRGTYEYFVFLRYDVFLDRSFLTQVPMGGEPAHRGLSFLGHGHDFLFFFPAEMWNCAMGFYEGCVQATEVGLNFEVHARSLETRRQHGCFQFGPLQLPEWQGSFGLAGFWMVLGRAFQVRRHELATAFVSQYEKNGTSCFDSSGRAHRCVGQTYFPPKNSFEDRFQPCFYHAR